MAKQEKQEVFRWENPSHKKGKFQWININELVIPVEGELPETLTNAKRISKLFQRSEKRPERTKKMAANWDWVLCGCLIVVLYKNVLYVVDGGHRLRAAKLNGKIGMMPCIVYNADEYTNPLIDMSKAFVTLQDSGIRVDARTKHKAANIAENPTAMLAERIITQNGYHTEHQGGKVFDAINALYSIIKTDPAMAESSFAICAEICDGNRIFKDILFGVFELERRAKIQKGHTAFNNGNIDKLKKIGVSSIVASINNAKAKLHVSGGSQGKIAGAMGILELINKGKSKDRLAIKFA